LTFDHFRLKHFPPLTSFKIESTSSMHRSPALTLLSESDRAGYSQLQALITRTTFTSPRQQRVKTFCDTLEAIRGFVMRDEPGDALRGMACGLYWLPDGIAVDVHEVRRLVPRCKSSINASLQKLGYSLSLGRLECAELLTKIFPLLRDQTAELRKWSIRKAESQRPSMILPILARPALSVPENRELQERWDDENSLGNFLTEGDRFEFK
jgi:hypothetical protein